MRLEAARRASAEKEPDVPCSLLSPDRRAGRCSLGVGWTRNETLGMPPESKGLSARWTAAASGCQWRVPHWTQHSQQSQLCHHWFRVGRVAWHGSHCAGLSLLHPLLYQHAPPLTALLLVLLPQHQRGRTVPERARRQESALTNVKVLGANLEQLGSKGSIYENGLQPNVPVLFSAESKLTANLTLVLHMSLPQTL